MVSVLISVYNQDPGTLVRDIYSQLQDLDKPFEIIIGNDYSDSKFMPLFDSLEELSHIKCFHPDKNLGRSKIRNALAKQARYENLLFIDGDALVLKEDFLSVYMQYADSVSVICGGTAYYEDPPEERQEILRWKYGVKREARAAKIRNQSPHSGFSSFNFLVPASVFNKIKFDESIVRYGHEDTIFGIELQKENVKVLHIDNQLIHNGLDDSEVFLEKTKEGLLNLLELLKNYKDPDVLERHIRILSKYSSLRKWGGHHLIRLIDQLSSGSIRRNLTGPRPSLALFDLYKLCILNKIQA